ncbi:MAG: hypothetical protein E7101_08550 [Prevotella ruminicola]|jgi:hypothetical protein|uniref:Phosphoenolpyruvate carboxykinase n=1 Tax=Xylanibacter ruminicola TaxID=839 RepID=A0A9D5P8L7_XYLRU|nr:hypothetical protein [Xylanibacter ruminicola]
MRETRYYEVAGHRFCVSGEESILALMTNYEPFACADGETVFEIDVEDGDAPDYSEEIRQEEEGQEIVCGHTAEGEAVFDFIWWGATAGWLVCSADYRKGRLVTAGRHTKMAIDNAIMIMFALATAENGTALFHAAVVSYEGKGYMFLGPSGTGKSTHASLWQRYIADTALVNDDNPVVRLGEDRHAVVYGSPWSGKTPCYRNVSCPLSGIVMLSQAPYNKICRLNGIHAYAALVESISGMRWDERIADGLHLTENLLASTVPVWHLECLPDEEAAKLCNETITR